MKLKFVINSKKFNNNVYKLDIIVDERKNRDILIIGEYIFYRIR